MSLMKSTNTKMDTPNKSLDKEQYFNSKFFPYLAQLYNYAFYLTKDEEDANDLVQDTFIKAFRFMDHFQEGTNEKAWLYKIMKNGFINDYRKKNSKPIHFSYDTIIEVNDSGEDDTPHNPLTETQLPDATDLFRGLMGDEVSGALEALPTDYRQILVLADIEEFSYEELSDILDIPIGTVRSRLFRARNLLKDKLYSYGKNLGYKDKRNHL